MKSKKSTILILLVSIICAIAIVVSSYFLDEMQYQQAQYIIIALWFVVFSYLATTSIKKENTT